MQSTVDQWQQHSVALTAVAAAAGAQSYIMIFSLLDL